MPILCIHKCSAEVAHATSRSYARFPGICNAWNKTKAKLGCILLFATSVCNVAVLHN